MEIKEFLYKINNLSRRKVMVEFIPSGNKAVISMWLCDNIRLEDPIPSSFVPISMTYFPFFSTEKTTYDTPRCYFISQDDFDLFLSTAPNKKYLHDSSGYFNIICPNDLIRTIYHICKIYKIENITLNDGENKYPIKLQELIKNIKTRILEIRKPLWRGLLEPSIAIKPNIRIQ